jgi:hypothetical protein
LSVRAVRVARPELRYSLERLVRAWDTKAAAEKAQMACRYVADTYPIGADYTPLEPHVDAAWRAETAGDWPGYPDALRCSMRAARAQAMERRGAA